MNRLQAFLRNSSPEIDVWDQKDVNLLRSKTSFIKKMSDQQIAELWSDFSGSEYAASWLDVTDYHYSEFVSWIIGVPGDGCEMCPIEWY